MADENGSNKTIKQLLHEIEKEAESAVGHPYVNDLRGKWGISNRPREIAKSPDWLIAKFAEYMEWIDQDTWKSVTRPGTDSVDEVAKYRARNNVPTLIGFSVYSGLTPNYIAELARGVHDIKEMSLNELKNKLNYKDINEIKELMIKGLLVLKGNNFSNVMNLIKNAIENELVNASMVESEHYAKINNRSIEFILKNHFGYKDKSEVEMTARETITFVNDIDSVPTEELINLNKPKQIGISTEDEKLKSKGLGFLVDEEENEIEIEPDVVTVVDGSDMNFGFLLGEGDV